MYAYAKICVLRISYHIKQNLTRFSDYFCACRHMSANVNENLLSDEFLTQIFTSHSPHDVERYLSFHYHHLLEILHNVKLTKRT